jgi:methyl-accepting chemotaxis protein
MLRAYPRFSKPFSLKRFAKDQYTSLMKYKRRIFLIDKPFQLRFSFYTVTWIGALGLAYPLIIENLLDAFIKVMSVAIDGPGLAQLEALRSQVLQQLIISHVGAILVVFVISVFMSHRIAGPLYKLRKYFEELGKGNLNQHLVFRKTDYFQPLAQDYNRMVEGLRTIIQKDADAVRAAVARIEAALPKTGDARKDLEEALSILRDARDRASR